MTFTQLNLDPTIAQAIAACGYTKPTPIQARCVPEILGGKDLVASAQTGSGKTAAFVLPALHRLASIKKTGMKPRVLILTPTRELATQITEAVSKYGKFMRVNIVSLVGGMPYRRQLKELSRPVDILVATPGRLMDHMENRRVDLSAIEMLILDEADRMLDMGFIDDVRFISKKTPNDRQTLLFSATVDNKLSTVIRELLKTPVRIDLSHETLAPAEIKQEIYLVDSAQHKNKLLKHFLENGNIFKAIVFSGTKINADKLTGFLHDQGYAAAALHGDLKQNQRTRTVEDLRRGKIQIVVATDVAARGIDIADLTHVINYDLPKFSEDYIHRIGRTGRAGKKGTAISFVSPTDARHFDKLKRFTGQKFQPMVVEGLEPKQAMYAPPLDRKRKGSRGRKISGEQQFAPKNKDHFKKDKSGSFASERRFGDKKRFNKDTVISFEDRRSAGGRERKPFNKTRDEGKSFTGERSFAPRDGARSARRGEGRSSAGERSFAPRDGARPARGGESRSSSGERSFAPRDSARPARRGEGRSSAGERSFASRDSARPARRGESRSSSGERSFAPRDSARPARRGESRSSSGERSFAPRDGARPAKRGEGRGFGGERSFASKGKRASEGGKPFSGRSKPKKRF